MRRIAGIIGPANTAAARKGSLAAMLDCMRHGRDHSFSTHVDESLGLSCGWVGDGAATEASSLPMWNEARDIGLIFSGEEFADRAEIQQLRSRGHDCDPDRPDYLVHFYEEHGLDFLQKLNGSFSGLLLDRREQRAILFNDRYGLGRIYFHEAEGGFYFSSEAKSLLKVLPGLRRIDLRSLGEFFSCGCVLQNRTLFSGVSLLPPASAWQFSAGQRVAKGVYFKPDVWEQLPILSAAEFQENLREVWKRILPRYFRGSEKVGLSLTGGVDSRMILAWAPRSAGELPCYTFGGPYRDCADVRISREVARISQQRHQVLSIGAEFLSQFPSLAARAVSLSDGALDVTGSIDVYVQKQVREIAPVRVTGTNGGEILRRLVAFKPSRICHGFLQPEVADWIEQAAGTYDHELKGHRLSFTAFKQAPWYMGSKFVVERFDLTLRMPYFDNALVALSYQAPAVLAESNEPARRLIGEGNPALNWIETDRGLAGRPIPGLGKLRHWYQEFSFRAEYAYDYGMPHWLARLDHAFAPLHLERLFLGRHKFHHFRVFYRNELAQYLKDTLLDSRSRGRPYLRPGCLEEVVDGHLRGHRNYTLEIHKLLTVELIERQLLEQN